MAFSFGRAANNGVSRKGERVFALCILTAGFAAQIEIGIPKTNSDSIT
jgi:hypothetical protein